MPRHLNGFCSIPRLSLRNLVEPTENASSFFSILTRHAKKENLVKALNLNVDCEHLVQKIL
jgi:hypothetical protein